MVTEYLVKNASPHKREQYRSNIIHDHLPKLRWQPFSTIEDKSTVKVLLKFSGKNVADNATMLSIVSSIQSPHRTSLL